MPLRANDSDRVCGSHPSDLSPRTAWQAGAGLSVPHVETSGPWASRPVAATITAAHAPPKSRVAVRTIGALLSVHTHSERMVRAYDNHGNVDEHTREHLFMFWRAVS